MAKSRNLSVVISGDSSQLSRSLSDANRRLDRFGKQTSLTARVSSRGFASMGLAAKGTAAALIGVGYAAKKLVDGASDINEALTKNDALFGRHAKTIDAFSKTTASRLGIARSEALAAAGTFGGLFAALDIGAKPAADMSKRLVTLAADLASFNNASPEEALEALRSGLSGEAEPMRRFNAFLSEGRVKTEAYKTGIAKTGAELTEQQKIQARYSLILKDTVKAHGDAEKTGEGFANQQRRLKATLKDTADTAGQALLPAFTKLVGYANTNIAPALQGVAKDLGGIAARKDIDLGKKLTMSWATVKARLTPVLDQVEEEIGRMKLGGKLDKAFTVAVPALMNAAAAAAPKAATRFVRAWWEAGAWAKLLTAGFIIGKMGGFSSAGSWAAGTLASRFKSALGRSKAIEAAGDAAGRSISANAAQSASTQLPMSMSARKGKFASAGRAMGRTIGFAAGVGFALSFMEPLEDLEHKIQAKMKKSKLGRAVDNILTWWPGGSGDVADGFNDLASSLGGTLPTAGAGSGGLSALASSGLSTIRSRFGGVRLSSGRRSPAENARVGGAPNSDHLTGNAIDLVPKGGWTASGVASMDRIAGWARSNPMVRWIGWRGVPGHGPGDHLHLSFRNRLGAGDVVGNAIGGLRAFGGKVRGVGDIATAARSARSAGFTGASLVTAVAVAGAESRYKARARLATSEEDSRGYWQINTLAHPWAKKMNLYDPATNARAARRVWREAGGFGPWTGFTSGNYKAFLARARKAVAGASGRTAPSAKSAEKPPSVFEQLTAASDAGTAAAALTASDADDRSQLTARRSIVQARLAKVTGALKKRTLRPATRLRLTQERASLLGDLGGIRERFAEMNAPAEAAEAEAPPTHEEVLSGNASRVGDDLSMIDLRERAGDMTKAEADAERARIRAGALAGSHGELSGRDWLQIRGDELEAMNALKESIEEAQRIQEEHTAALAANTAEMKRQNDFATSVANITSREAVRALADMVSGQIGSLTFGRGMSAGSGAIARY